MARSSPPASVSESADGQEVGKLSSTRANAKKASEEPELNGTEDEEDGEEDGEPEYEIEQILDAKKGAFGDRMGYWVKWKGYDEADNSWVDEKDAGNAQDLINIYWAKVVAEKNSRKSLTKSATKRARKSTSVDAAATSSPIETKKRGRKSKADSVPVPEGDEMDVDEDDKRTTKKQKKPPRKSESLPKEEEEGVDTIEEEERIGDMKKYMNVPDWEHLISAVDTVEHDKESGQLIVYFRLKASNERVKEISSVCKTRFPQHLLDFYEANLRWREAEEEEGKDS